MEQNQSGLKNPFLSQLVNSISSKLPYQKQEYKDDAVNPYFKTFRQMGIDREEKVKNRAVSTFNPDYGIDISDVTADAGYFNFIYNNANNDKANRLMEYRMMAQYSDVANALDKICDAFTVVDDKGKVVKLLIDPEVEMDSMIEGELLKEFRFIENHFNFKKKGWRYIRKVLVEAEQYFENIISKDRPDLGIIGMVEIPNQLIDPIYDNVQNMCIKGYVLKKYEYDSKTRSHDVKLVPLEKNQVTYINSDMFNETNTIRLPFLENARRAFRQLTMIEDAIVIYRMVRAPERIKYGVEVGNMPKPQTEAYLRGLMQKHWSKKTYDLSSQSTGTGITNVYNPQSMLDAYWIPVRDGQPQMTVDVMQGGQNLGKLEDLQFFQKKLYEALKIPANRLDPESSFTDGAEINRQELEFANFIIRLQNYFAEGLKQTFITHLKLRGLWEQYQLHENDFEVKFNEPTHFFELSNQQIKEIRYNNFNTLVANPHFSPTHLMKVELKMTDQEILTNRKHRKLDAALEWEISQIIANGPDFREQAENAGGGEGGPPMGGGPGGGSSMPTGGGDIGGEDSSGPGGGDINNPPEFGGGDVPEGAPSTPEKPSNNK